MQLSDNTRNLDHDPVLLQEVVEFALKSPLAVEGSEYDHFIDMTFGLGGHTRAVLEKLPWAKVFALDADPETCEKGRAAFAGHISSGRLTICNANFSNFADAVPPAVRARAFAAMADFGISNFQLFSNDRGFSFDSSSSFDMRVDRHGGGITAYDVINGHAAKDIADMLYGLADEKLSREIAAEIVKRREKAPISSCAEFADIVRSVYKRHPRIRMEIDFATKALMALRIFVNDEFGNIERMLASLSGSLPKGAVVMAISFHSNEDRIVKDFLARETRDCLCPRDLPICACGHRARFRAVVKKTVVADEAQKRSNPRARSARMRVFELI